MTIRVELSEAPNIVFLRALARQEQFGSSRALLSGEN